ncbi:pyruvate, phosphate dikinase [Nonomuraea monospora]|uniref:Pyruvate, phosphate dikinase n=1 Tax=Nonomuraea monospora TaxID=568818 RepID=A0ABN3D5F5_9ACTN
MAEVFSGRHAGFGEKDRTAATPAEGAEVRFPPRLSLRPDLTDDGAIAEALSALDPLGRLGSDREPVFLSLLAARSSGRRFSYLGLTTASERWLTEVSPDHLFAADCRAALEETFRHGGLPGIPDDPVDQVLAAVRGLAQDHPGAELTLGVMPLGLGHGNGSGLAWSCDPVTGEPGLTGSFGAGLTGAQLLASGGADLAAEAATAPWGRSLAQLVRAAQLRAGRPVRVDFVVTGGELFALRVDHAGFGGRAVVRTVAALVREGRLSTGAALTTATDTDVAQAVLPVVDTGSLPLIAQGLGVSPGVADGAIVFDPADAIAAERAGRPAVLVLPESRPEHLDGLLAAAAVITERGGRTAHAAVVTRGLGKPCVTALRGATVDAAGRCLRLPGGDILPAGAVVTVDARTGSIRRGACKRLEPEGGEPGDDVAWLLSQVSGLPQLTVRCNADGADAARRGLAAGAAGVGLCRIEHMFLGGRRKVLERVMLAPRGASGAEAFAALYEILRAEFAALLAATDGLPLVIRLLDPPRHEFLPDTTVQRLREVNPMLGVRGVRLAILMPELARCQIRALVEATEAARRAGGDPRPRLLVPMVADPGEVDAVRRLVDEVADRPGKGEPGRRIPIGAMIETPRAALMADALATRADFLSFGTNDLSALVWGLSRDDAEAELLPGYRELGVLPESPFELLDTAVRDLVASAIAAARAVRPGIEAGVCGEHAAEPSALRAFADIGVTYVSCVPSAVPLVRFAAARLAAASAEDAASPAAAASPEGRHPAQERIP